MALIKGTSYGRNIRERESEDYSIYIVKKSDG